MHAQYTQLPVDECHRAVHSESCRDNSQVFVDFGRQFSGIQIRCVNTTATTATTGPYTAAAGSGGSGNDGSGGIQGRGYGFGGNGNSSSEYGGSGSSFGNSGGTGGGDVQGGSAARSVPVHSFVSGEVFGRFRTVVAYACLESLASWLEKDNESLVEASLECLRMAVNLDLAD